MTINDRIEAFTVAEPEATAAIVAIASKATPSRFGFERAAACGLADCNRWDGYTLTKQGIEVAAWAQA